MRMCVRSGRSSNRRWCGHHAIDEQGYGKFEQMLRPGITLAQVLGVTVQLTDSTRHFENRVQERTHRCCGESVAP